MFAFLTKVLSSTPRSRGHWSAAAARPRLEAFEDRCLMSVGLRGDFDGDGMADMAVFRPSDGIWQVLTSSSFFNNGFWQQWGAAGDIPIQNSDFDGDRRTDVAVFRPSDGTWYV